MSDREPGAVPEADLDPFDVIADALYPLYHRHLEGTLIERRVGLLLRQARRATMPALFLTRALAVGISVAALILIISFVATSIFYGLGNEINLGLQVNRPVLVFLANHEAAVGVVGITTVAVVVGFIVALGVPLTRLWMVAGSRESEIEALMLDAMTQMQSLSRGGLGPVEILESVARSDDVYGELSAECQTIINRIELFGVDYRQAIRQQAAETPSYTLSNFLENLAAAAGTGGDLERFFDDKVSDMRGEQRREREQRLNRVGLLGQLYAVGTIFPLIGLVLLIVLSMQNKGLLGFIYLLVYLALPFAGAVFLVIIGMVTDESFGGETVIPTTTRQTAPGAGIWEFINGRVQQGRAPAESAAVKRYRRREQVMQSLSKLGALTNHFITQPRHTWLASVPIGLALLGASVHFNGMPTPSAISSAPIEMTLLYIYLPVIAILAPVAAAEILHDRRKSKVEGQLTDVLRELASANETGLTFIAAIGKLSADEASSRLVQDLETIRSQTVVGGDQQSAIAAWANQYQERRIARLARLLIESVRTSSDISETLTTAAKSSALWDEFRAERADRVRKQLVIVSLTFLIMLGVLGTLESTFISTLAEISQQTGGGQAPGSSGGVTNSDQLVMLAFHAATIQALSSGLITGYLKARSLTTGARYALIMLLMTAGVFVII